MITSNIHYDLATCYHVPDTVRAAEDSILVPENIHITFIWQKDLFRMHRELLQLSSKKTGTQ